MYNEYYTSLPKKILESGYHTMILSLDCMNIDADIHEIRLGITLQILIGTNQMLSNPGLARGFFVCAQCRKPRRLWQRGRCLGACAPRYPLHTRRSPRWIRLCEHSLKLEGHHLSTLGIDALHQIGEVPDMD